MRELGLQSKPAGPYSTVFITHPYVYTRSAIITQQCGTSSYGTTRIIL